MINTTIGKANIDITAENSQLKAKLAESQAEIEKLRKKDSGLVKKFDEAEGSVRKLLKAILALPAAAAAGFAAGRKLREAFDLDGTKIIETFQKINSLDLSKPVEAMAALNKEIQDLQNARAAVEGDLINSLYARLVEGESDTENRLKLAINARTILEARAVKERAAEEDRVERERRQKVVDGILALNKEREKAAEREQDQRNQEFSEAVEDEMRHREWLRQQDRDAHEERIRQIEEENEARMEGMREYQRIVQETIRMQESGFGIGNITFAQGGGGARTALSSRIGRGNAGRF